MAPGLYLNLGSKGHSWTIGPRGASISVGSRGTYFNQSIPGLGLYNRTKLGSRTTSTRPATRPSPRSPGISPGQRAQDDALVKRYNDIKELRRHPPKVQLPAVEGPILLFAHGGAALDSRLVETAWNYCYELIADSVEEHLHDQKYRVEQLGQLHLKIPPAGYRPKFQAISFDEPKPTMGDLASYGLTGRMISSQRREIDEQNKLLKEEYAADHQAWLQRKQAHESFEHGREKMYAIRDTNTPVASEGFLTWHLEHLAWPQETSLCLEMSKDATELYLDINLPEIEDFPKGHQEFAGATRSVRWASMSEQQRRTLYMDHVHGIGLRITGEAFAHDPKLRTVLVSGFSQRPNRATGIVEDQYLYSAIIRRDVWMRLDFSHLNWIDPSKLFNNFETRRDLSPSGVFSPIDPIVPPGAPP